MGWLKKYQSGGYSNSGAPKAQYGRPVNSPSTDSLRHLAGQMMDYEAIKGSPIGTPLSNWGYHQSQLPYNQVPSNWTAPQTKQEAVNRYMQEIAGTGKLDYYPSAMEKAEAGDFIYNTGRDPRVYMLDQYLKSKGQAGIPSRGLYNVDNKSAQWTPDLQNSLDQQWGQYQSDIMKLPTNDRRILMNKGRDFYYQNINKKADGSPNDSYEATWKPRIWESVNSYKKNGGYSTTGYKADSPDRNNPYNIIPSGRITMQNVPHPVLGIDNLGNKQMMQPGGEYQFQGDRVFEVPAMKEGGIPQRYKNMGFTRVGQKKTGDGQHKWKVLAKKGDSYKVVQGGYRGMQDFKQHHSEERKDRFWDRMGGRNSSKAKDPFSPLYWHKRFGTWEYGGPVEMKGGGVPSISNNTPTTKDSLDLYNNNAEVLSYYRNKNYKEYPAYYIKDNNVIKNIDLDYEEFQKNNKLKEIRYINKNNSAIEGSIPDNFYREEIDKNKFKQRESASSILDTRSPKQLFDRRIKPSIHYGFDNMDRQDPLYGDAVSVYSYDPLAVKPVSMLTPEEKALREKRYGAQSYSKNKTESFKRKGIDIDKLQNSIEASNYQPQQTQIPGFIPKILEEGWYSNSQGVGVDAEDFSTLYNQDGTRKYKDGGMIKRADGSYSQRGLWDNIRANAGSGKKPTKEMLQQERKIRSAEKKEYGGWLDQYQSGGVAPYITHDPNDPRIQAHKDSVDFYNQAKGRYNPGYPKISIEKYIDLQKKNAKFPYYSFDDDKYKTDKAKGKVDNFEDYVYQVGREEGVLSPKDKDAYYRNVGKHFRDTLVTEPLKDGTEKHYSTVIDGKLDKSEYTLYNPRTKTSRHYIDNTMIGIYNPNMKPIDSVFTGEDKPREIGKISLSSKSTGRYDPTKAKPEFKSTGSKDFINQSYPLWKNYIYEEPVQDVIYQKDPSSLKKGKDLYSDSSRRALYWRDRLGDPGNIPKLPTDQLITKGNSQPYQPQQVLAPSYTPKLSDYNITLRNVNPNLKDYSEEQVEFESPQEQEKYIRDNKLHKLSTGMYEDVRKYKQGGMIKRADGSYSQRGLWDNIRANAGSGKKPTKEMLQQERKIRSAEKKEYGGWLNEYQSGGVATIDNPIYKGTVAGQQVSSETQYPMSKREIDEIARERKEKEQAQKIKAKIESSGRGQRTIYPYTKKELAELYYKNATAAQRYDQNTWQDNVREQVGELPFPSNMVAYPAVAAANVSQPSRYFENIGQREEGMLNAGMVPVNVAMDVAALAPAASPLKALTKKVGSKITIPRGYTGPMMTDLVPIEPVYPTSPYRPPGGRTFPVLPARTPTGMPTLVDVPELTKEQEILQSFGLDPYKTLIKNPEYMSLEAPKGNMYGQNQVLIQQSRLLNPKTKAKFFEHQAPVSGPKESILQKMPADYNNRITPENYEDFVNRVHSSTDYDFASAPKTGANLGIGSYGRPGMVYKDAPLNNLGKDIINAHEKNHGIFAGTLSKEMNEDLLKPFGTSKPIPHYSGKHQPDEVLARMAQFKNAVGIGDNQTFTLGHLNLIRKNYPKQFLDNGITEMLEKIKPGTKTEKEFLKNMNKYAFGATGIGAGVAASQGDKQKYGGWLKKYK